MLKFVSISLHQIHKVESLKPICKKISSGTFGETKSEVQFYSSKGLFSYLGHTSAFVFLRNARNPSQDLPNFSPSIKILRKERERESRER
jgi:hypothetical protein